MLLESFDYFWRGPEPLPIHIIVPDDELVEIRSVLTENTDTPHISINIVTDGFVSPLLNSVHHVSGTAKQMIIKLAAFKFVSTPFYLTLDSDIVACKPFQERDLFLGQKALTEWAIPTLMPWWQQSAALLDLPSDPQSIARGPRLFVTPQVMSCEISRKLTEHLDKLLSKEWVAALIEKYTGNHPHIWTEYTLYDLFATEYDLLSKYYWLPEEMPSTWRLHVPGQSIWYADQFDSWNPELALLPGIAGFFAVLQSITAHNLDFDRVQRRWLKAVSRFYPDYPRSGDPDSVKRSAVVHHQSSPELTSFSLPGLDTVAVYSVLGLLRPYDIDLPKRRFGGRSDGGYVLADVLTPLQPVLSYSASTKRSFEDELLSHGLDVHTKPPSRLGVATACDNIIGTDLSAMDIPNKNAILRLDIEGAEWDILASIEPGVFSHIQQIVIEGHWLHKLRDNDFREIAQRALSRLAADFTLFHVHANNFGTVSTVEGLLVPDVIELSYVRTSMVQRKLSETVYPTNLDFPNNPHNHDIVLSFYPFVPTYAETMITDAASQVVRQHTARRTARDLNFRVDG